MNYPVEFEVARPTQTFDRGATAGRVLLIIVLYWLLNGIIGLVWLILPVFGAIMISQKGPEKYLAEAEQGPVSWIRIIMGFLSYASLLTDKLPLENPTEAADIRVQPTGSPSVGQVLLRIILAIPHWFVLAFVGFVGAFVWLATVIVVLLNGTYPDWGYAYLRGYLRWNTRVMGYLAGLAEAYPPFSFDELMSSPPALPSPSLPPSPPSAPPA